MGGLPSWAQRLVFEIGPTTTGSRALGAASSYALTRVTSPHLTSPHLVVMFTKHKHTAEALTAAWLLPVVPPITIAAVGSGLCTLLIARERYEYALTIMITSYVMNGVGLLIACGIMVIYFQRLAVHHLPAREIIVSTFLPLGPCGQGGFALIELGRNAMSLFPLLAASQPHRATFAELALVGHAMYGAGVVTGLLLWGLGVWWMFLAVVSVGSHYIGTPRVLRQRHANSPGSTPPKPSHASVNANFVDIDPLFLNTSLTAKRRRRTWFIWSAGSMVFIFASILFSYNYLDPPLYVEAEGSSGTEASQGVLLQVNNHTAIHNPKIHRRRPRILLAQNDPTTPLSSSSTQPSPTLAARAFATIATLGDVSPPPILPTTLVTPQIFTAAADLARSSSMTRAFAPTLPFPPTPLATAAARPFIETNWAYGGGISGFLSFVDDPYPEGNDTGSSVIAVEYPRGSMGGGAPGTEGGVAEMMLNVFGTSPQQRSIVSYKVCEGLRMPRVRQLNVR
ncbi:hypothetical protein P7C70_g2726, partial [Phenoliferia sp. Uapishka_3]